VRGNTDTAIYSLYLATLALHPRKPQNTNYVCSFKANPPEKSRLRQPPSSVAVSQSVAFKSIAEVGNLFLNVATGVANEK
jgi:hypothetical protein